MMNQKRKYEGSNSTTRKRKVESRKCKTDINKVLHATIYNNENIHSSIADIMVHKCHFIWKFQILYNTIAIISMPILL